MPSKRKKITSIGKWSLNRVRGVTHFPYKIHSSDREYFSIGRGFATKPLRKILQEVFLKENQFKSSFWRTPYGPMKDQGWSWTSLGSALGPLMSLDMVFKPKLATKGQFFGHTCRKLMFFSASHNSQAQPKPAIQSPAGGWDSLDLTTELNHRPPTQPG